METRLDNLKEKKTGKHLIYLAILILLSYMTLDILFKDIRITELYHSIKELNIFMVVLALLSMFVFIVCEALVFKSILSILEEKVSFFQVLKYSIIGFYFSSITPSASGGQPMQLYYMKKDRISIAKGSLTVLISLIIYQVVMMTYGSVSIMLNLIFVVSQVTSIYPLIIFGFVANTLVIALILTSMFSTRLIFKIWNLFINLLYKLKLIKDIEKVKDYSENQINQYKEGASLIRSNPKTIILILLLTFIQHSCLYSVSYFVYKALGLGGISFWHILGLQAISHLASSSIPLPGSVGVSETASLIILKNIFPGHLLSSAILIIRIISFYTMVIISGIFTMLIQLFYTREDKL